MQEGGLFLADEISLADDSVLERLNSLLEPERKLLLAEKGGGDVGSGRSCIVAAEDNFHFIGTMNLGGDYGKKELSPVLRNRFTEIWCESCRERQDLLAIIEHNLKYCLLLGNQEDGTSGVGNHLLDFVGLAEQIKGKGNLCRCTGYQPIIEGFSIFAKDGGNWNGFLNGESEECPLGEKCFKTTK